MRRRRPGNAGSACSSVELRRGERAGRAVAAGVERVDQALAEETRTPAAVRPRCRARARCGTRRRPRCARRSSRPLSGTYQQVSSRIVFSSPGSSSNGTAQRRARGVARHRRVAHEPAPRRRCPRRWSARPTSRRGTSSGRPPRPAVDEERRRRRSDRGPSPAAAYSTKPPSIGPMAPVAHEVARVEGEHRAAGPGSRCC